MNSEDADASQVHWLKNKIQKKEAISKSDFAHTFGYFSMGDAEKAFKAVLSKSVFSQATRASVLSKYEVWNRNEGATFWAFRRATQSSTISLTESAEALVSEGKYVAKDLVREGRALMNSYGSNSMTEESSRDPCDAFFAGQKHVRDTCGELDGVLRKASRDDTCKCNLEMKSVLSH